MGKGTFVSYSREDAEFALKLVNDLRSEGVDVWMDQLDIPPGELWDRAVERALKFCECLLVILSPASVQSENVLDEVTFALGKNKQIVPVLHKTCEIPFRLLRLQHINFTKNYQDGLIDLLKTLDVWQPSQTREEPEASDISGRWKADEIEETEETRRTYFTFKVVGDKLFGTVLLPPSWSTQRKSGIINGKINGDRVSFTTKHEYDKEFGRYDSMTRQHIPPVRAQFTAYYQGEIMGEEIHFIRQTEGDYAEFTAKRIIDLTERPSPSSKSERSPSTLPEAYAFIYTLPGHKGGVLSMSFGPDKGRLPSGGLRLASGGAEDCQIKYWDTATAEPRGSDYLGSNLGKGYVSVAYRPHMRDGFVDLKAVGVSKKGHMVRFFHNGGVVKEIQGVVGPVAISPDLSLVATAETEGSDKSTITLRSPYDGDIKRTLACRGVICAVALSMDGSLLASAETVGSDDTAIKLWDTATGAVKWDVPSKPLVNVLAFSPNGTLLASGGAKDGQIKIWDVATGASKLTLRGDTEAVVSTLTFSDTGSLLASGGVSSSVIKLWDMATGTINQTLENEGPVGALAFSRDGRLLASGDAEKGVIKIWAKPR